MSWLQGAEATMKGHPQYFITDTESYLLKSDGVVEKSLMPLPVFDTVPNYVFGDSVDMPYDVEYGMHILVASNTRYFKEFQIRIDEVRTKGKKLIDITEVHSNTNRLHIGYI